MSFSRAGLFVLLVAVILGGAYLVWFSATHTSLLELVNVFQPGPEEAPPAEPLTPVALPESEGADVDLTLVEKLVVVPEQYRLGALREPRLLKVPASAEVSVFAAGFAKARFMAVSPAGWPAGEGILYLTESDAGRVFALPDRNNDGVADENVLVASGMDFPHGIVFSDGALWVATTTTVRKLYDDDGDLRAERSEVVISDLPAGGNHVSRTIAFGPDGKLYMSIGSSCNVCQDDPRRAAILRFNADGSGEELFAAGVRNSVGIVFDEAGQLWGTDNGRDLLGDDVPPEEVNILREGRHYGWPYCYASGVTDRSFSGRFSSLAEQEAFCAQTSEPVVQMQAHTAPLGLRFLNDERLPRALRGDLLVALHGSWNRTVPVGYEIVRIEGFAEHPVLSVFVTGFLPAGQTKAWGRPVDVIVGGDGAIYISDDAAGAVYRLAFRSAGS